MSLHPGGPRVKVRLTALNLLRQEYRDDLHVARGADDEKLVVFKTAWYRDIKARLTPGACLKVIDRTG